MSTAKTHKRMRIGVIFLLIITITAVNRCRIDTTPIVSGGNPPIIEFNRARGQLQLYVLGPFALKQLKQEYKQEYKITEGKNVLTAEEQKELERIRDNKDYSMWQLDPGTEFNVFGLSITYGIVPNGFKQVYPADGRTPEPLIEGMIYSVVLPNSNCGGPNVESEYFMINNGKAVIIPPSQITDK